MLHPEPFSFGTIPIYRYEILAMKLETALDQYTVERVAWPARVVPQSNDYNYIYMTLKVEQSSYDLWLNYINNQPANLQMDVDFGFFSSISYALESMDVDVIKVVNNGLNQYKYMYKLDLTFIRAI